MLAPGGWLAAETLQKLYRSFTRDPGEIRGVLEDARVRGVILNGGCNRLTQARSARIAAIERDHLVLETHCFGEVVLAQVPLSFAVEGRRWFFVTIPRERIRAGRLLTGIPTALYEPERRDLARSAPEIVARAPRRVELRDASGRSWGGRVIDWSYYGMCVEIRETASVGEHVEVHTGESGAPITHHARVRHRALSTRPGWVRLGLQTSTAQRRDRIKIETCSEIEPDSGRQAIARRAARGMRALADRAARSFARAQPEPEVPIVEFHNARGERLRAIIDRVGQSPEAPLVLIPPAWGRTKETVAPLALTILETFRSLGFPIAVLRFDGTRRRGESYNDPECLLPGDEYRHFTFSGAVDDVRAALAFTRASEALRPSSIIVVSSSLASIEARRALAEADDARIGGWISLVGLIDLHTVLRAVSGGIDYGLGVLRGVEFGVQDLFGVRCDIDRVVSDAIDNRLWFLEDARRDLASMKLPVTWIHGRNDAWTDLENVKDALSSGAGGQRRLLEIPIGHQLRSSREALGVFRLVAGEIGRMLTGRTVSTAGPERRELQRRERAERSRLPLPHFDLQRFWRDYLVGRSGELGMELLTASSSYRALVAAEVEALELGEGDRVADLGSGIGDLAVFLGTEAGAPPGVTIHALDYVAEALRRQQERLSRRGFPQRVGMVLADLGVGGRLFLPLKTEGYDAVLAGLLLTYLPDPEAFLAEVFRVLRPGGRLVVSGIRPDADVSKLYLDSMEELPRERLAELFGERMASSAPELRRTFLSDASRILDLEEFGYFRFWDAEDLARMVSEAGFCHLKTTEVFGDPPQAILVQASRPG